MKNTAIMFKYIMLALLVMGFSACNNNEQHQKSSHFDFVVKGNIDTVKTLPLVNLLEENYNRVSQFLETKPDSPIEVNIYANRLQYGFATGNWGASGSIEGSAKLHFIQQAWDEKDIGKIAVHEFTHTVTLKLLINQESKPLDSKKFDQKFATLPTWLWEGISIYEANQFVDPRTLPFMANAHYPELAELNNRSKGQKIYQVGYILIEYILQKYGRDKLIALIKSYGNIPLILNVSEKDFMKDWDNFVIKKYFPKPIDNKIPTN